MVRMVDLAKTVIGVVVVSLCATTVETRGQILTEQRKPNLIVHNPDVGARRELTADSRHDGKSLDYWIKVIHDRDEKMLSLAFAAIHILGPEAWPAVPELTRVVTAPFTPIRLGRDSDELITSKLYDIEIRSAAIDALAAIGEAASPATIPLVRWALTIRVIPANTTRREDAARFLDLVTLDVDYRIGVINAIEHFRDKAFPMLARLLRSTDAEQRKFAVIILGTDVVPVITDLLNSRNCEDQELGLTLLNDMDSVVAKAYLAELERMRVCEAAVRKSY